MKFGIYREVKSERRATSWSRPAPTRVKVVEADTAFDAAKTFRRSQPNGWREEIIQVGYRGRTADVWVRRFTPTGRYKGETHFMVWPID